jgi:hypothetical protein
VVVADGGDASYTREDFEAYRATVSIVLALDGRPFASEQTASKRLPPVVTLAGTTVAYYFQQGRVLAPEELVVGSHTLAMDFSDRDETFSTAIVFTIDTPGTGACL